MIPWKHLPMADKRKSISGSVLRKDEKHWCSAITKYKEKSCSYTHIILLFLLHIYNITFFTWYCRGGGKWPFNVWWITLDGKQYIHTNRNKLIIRTFQHWNEAKQSIPYYHKRENGRQKSNNYSASQNLNVKVYPN